MVHASWRKRLADRAVAPMRCDRGSGPDAGVDFPTWQERGILTQREFPKRFRVTGGRPWYSVGCFRRELPKNRRRGGASAAVVGGDMAEHRRNPVGRARPGFEGPGRRVASWKRAVGGNR